MKPSQRRALDRLGERVLSERPSRNALEAARRIKRLTATPSDFRVAYPVWTQNLRMHLIATAGLLMASPGFVPGERVKCNFIFDPAIELVLVPPDEEPPATVIERVRVYDQSPYVVREQFEAEWFLEFSLLAALGEGDAQDLREELYSSMNSGMSVADNVDVRMLQREMDSWTQFSEVTSAPTGHWRHLSRWMVGRGAWKLERLPPATTGHHRPPRPYPDRY